LRPEFVKKYSNIRTSLSADAFSSFARNSPDRLQNNQEIIEASEYLLREQIPLFSKRLLTFVSTDVWAFIDEMHRYGLNYRHLGEARKFIMKNQDSVHWTNLLLIEMVARIIKNEVRSIMRQSITNQKLPGDLYLKQATAEYISLVFGTSSKSVAYWETELKQKLRTDFPRSLSEEEINSNSIMTQCKAEKNICLLFSRVIQLSGIGLVTQRFNSPNAFEFDFPFDDSDIQTITEKVKSMSLAAYMQKAILFESKP